MEAIRQPVGRYYKATNTDHIAMLGREAQQAQKKRERTNEKKEMPTTTARQSTGAPPPLQPPESTHHRPRLQSASYQAAPPRRDATPTTLLPGRVLGFPRAHEGRWGVDTTDTLQEGMMAPAGVTASGLKPAGISPAFQPQPPNRTEPTCQTVAHHHAPTQ